MGLSLMFTLRFFGVNVTNSKGSPDDGSNTAELSGTAQMYIKELWNSQCSILIGFVVYFIGGYFLYSSFYAAIGPLLIIKPIHNNFSTHHYAFNAECLCRFFLV
jgi:ABC-2 type transport system permease protein